MIKYGPLCWPENEAEIDHPQCNYPKLYDGQFPSGVDKYGIPLDHKGMQCLDRSSILHPDSTVETVEVTVDNGTVFKFRVPSAIDAKHWFDNEFLYFSVELYLKYAIKYIFNTQRGMLLNFFTNYKIDNIDTIVELLLKDQVRILEEELKNES